MDIFLILAIPVLIVLHAFFTLLSSAILNSRIKKIEDEEFKVNFGKTSAISILKKPLVASFTAQVIRLLSFLLLVLLIFKLHVSFGLYDQITPISIIICALSYLLFVVVIPAVLVHLSWSVSHAVPEKSLCLTAPSAKPFLVLFTPLGILARRIFITLKRAFNFESPSTKKNRVSIEDIADLVDYGNEMPEDKEEMSMVKGLVELAETTVEEVMVPRQDMIAIEEDASFQEVVALLKESGFSRIPVIRGSLDEVCGLLLSRDLIDLLDKNFNVSEFNLKDYTRHVDFVAGSENLLNLLTHFKAEKSHFAVVHDEHGGVDGIVTMEDVLEEIVGDIFDEHDQDAVEEVQETLSGDLMIDGSAMLAEVNEEYSLNFPEGEYDTIAGFVLSLIGRLPNDGEIINYQQFQFVVEEFADNRIKKLRVVLNT